jgi:hypothetical protein
VLEHRLEEHLDRRVVLRTQWIIPAKAAVTTRTLVHRAVV